MLRSDQTEMITHNNNIMLIYLYIHFINNNNKNKYIFF